MEEAFVSYLVESLVSLIAEEVRQSINLVVGVNEEVEGLTNNLKMIRALLEDAEKRRIKEIDVQGWLVKLKGLSYDMDDVLDEWNTELLKASFPKPKIRFSTISSCFCLKQVSIRHNIASRIKDLNTRLEIIIKEKDKFKFAVGERVGSNVFRPTRTTSLVQESEVFGRDDDKVDLITQLLDEGRTDSQEQDDDKVHVMSIVATGGLGKTTLAQLVYNDEDVDNKFELKIWVCVSDPFDLTQIAKAILESLKKRKEAHDLNELEALLKVVKTETTGKKFLLVLDDVWNKNYELWEPLRNSLQKGGRGSKVLVTTRNEEVATMMRSEYVHPLGSLSDYDCWSVFKRIAFAGRKKDVGRLEDIGRAIVKKCDGMPLATKTLAGLLRLKYTREDWKNVLDSELWKLDVAAMELFPHLYLSFCDMPPVLRPCFTYCAVFPKDHVIEVADLIKLWMAQGYLATSSNVEVELTGREYFNDLAMRSLFQDFERDEFGEEILSCKMHDIVHDFAQYMAGNECMIMQNESGSIPTDIVQVRHFNWISRKQFTCIPTVCTTGKLRSFLAGRVPAKNHFQDLLSNLKHIRSLRLKDAGVEEIPKEINSLIHLRYLNLSENYTLRELPKEVCDLINLETLDIFQSGIRALPRAIGKLINLRHLVLALSREENYPQSVEKLKNLRTFDGLVLRRGNNLGCLKNLNNLRGSLSIMVSDNVDVAERTEMEKAELRSKEHIKEFSLWFKNFVHFDYSGDRAAWTDSIDVLGSPPNIEVLYLRGLPTTQFPIWITSLCYLRDLRIFSCRKWSSLPPLGRLPHLESLRIMGLLSCRHIGRSFLGVEGDVGRDASNGTSTGEASASESSFVVVKLFPKLELLYIRYCDIWEEWEDLTENDENNFLVFPKLRKLDILDCDRLKALPLRLLGMATSLESLGIHHCDLLPNQELSGRVAIEEFLRG